MLLFVIFSSSWRIYAVGKENEKSLLFRMEENLAEENDNGFDDREARLESHDKGKREFDDAELENTDDDLYFSQDDGEFEKRKSVDYSEWDSNEQFKLNDDTEEAEEKEEKEEEEAEKGMFKKLFEKFKNWIRKIGKRKSQD